MRTKITLFTMMLAIFSIGLFAQPDVWNRQEKIHSKFQKENNFQMFSESYPSQEKEIPSLLNKRKQDQLKKDQLIQSERNVLPDFLKKKEGPLFIFSSRENKQNFTSKNFLQKAKNAYNVRAEIKQRLDSVVYVERDENTNEWLTSYKNEYAYDERGNLILEAWYHWDSDTERWEGDYKSEYIYDENRNCISEAGYDWDSDTEQWEGDCKYEYTYDERGSLILKAYYRWDSDTEQWEVYYKYEYTYDERGSLILKAYYRWDSDTEQWEEYNKYEYTYDERGNLILEAQYYWDSDTEQWGGDYKYEYAYDERGNLILEVDYNWNNINQQWQPTYKYAVDYDYNYFNDDLLLPPYVDFKNKVVNYIVYKSSDGVNWTESGKGIYYYSDIEMAVSQISMGSIKLYPNPVVNDLNIVLPDDIQQAEFKLFDLHGRMLVTKNIVADKKVNLEKLAAGVYLYQIIT
ncbi:MAG TPA: DUF3836 domain-containing protein, partial [Paludibacteraceae bacterium]|nr:DUF3836 domain-containing protein [Paludibacteraceae bacterium]